MATHLPDQVEATSNGDCSGKEIHLTLNQYKSSSTVAATVVSWKTFNDDAS